MRRVPRVCAASAIALAMLVGTGVAGAGPADTSGSSTSSTSSADTSPDSAPDTGVPDSAAPTTAATTTTTTIAPATRGSTIQLVTTLPPPPTVATLPTISSPYKVPANSGSGRRIVYSKSQMRVWII